MGAGGSFTVLGVHAKAQSSPEQPAFAHRLPNPSGPIAALWGPDLEVGDPGRDSGSHQKQKNPFLATGAAEAVGQTSHHCMSLDKSFHC